MADSIFIVRHGETAWSASGKHTGRTDVPLTEAGRAQADRLAGRLTAEDFTLVLCSPLERARETCARAGFADVAELCPDLAEWDYGDYDGLTTPEIREINPDWDLWTQGSPGGETPTEVGTRADRVLARFAAVEGVGLAFAHGHLLRVLTARWLEFEPEAGRRFTLATAGLGTLGHERQTAILARWNA